MYMTGIPACDALCEIRLTGNVIPQIWYKIFVKTELKAPKPHLLAINVLADIVYWYRPEEVRDEQTGEIIGYRKKFSGDMLQRSYTQIANQFGCSERQAKDAIVFLESMGVVRRELRVIETRGTVCSNVLFLDLDADRLRRLTFPGRYQQADQERQNASQTSAPFFAAPYDEKTADLCQNPAHPITDFCQTCDKISADLCQNSDTPLTKFRQTNTETSTEISTEISTKNSTEISNGLSVSQSPACARVKRQTDRQTDFSSAEEVIDYLHENGIAAAALSCQSAKLLVHRLCEYDLFTETAPEKTMLRDAEHLEAFRLFADCLRGMICTRKGVQVCGETVTARDVLDRIRCLAPNWYLGELCDFAAFASDRFIRGLNCANVKNARGYMQSIIWNGFSEYRYEQLN